MPNLPKLARQLNERVWGGVLCLLEQVRGVVEKRGVGAGLRGGGLCRLSAQVLGLVRALSPRSCLLHLPTSASTQEPLPNTEERLSTSETESEILVAFDS